MGLRKLFAEREPSIRRAMLNDEDISDRYKAYCEEIEILRSQAPSSCIELWERCVDLTEDLRLMENEAFFKAGFKIATTLLLESI